MNGRGGCSGIVDGPASAFVGCSAYFVCCDEDCGRGVVYLSSVSIGNGDECEGAGDDGR